MDTHKMVIFIVNNIFNANVNLSKHLKYMYAMASISKGSKNDSVQLLFFLLNK